MTRIYAIHTGSYSDQGWGPVFSTIERAQTYVAQNPEEESRIEVYVLDDENDTGPSYPGWRLIFDRDGNVLFSEHFTPIPYEPQLYGKAEVRLVPADARWYMLKEIKPKNRAHIIVSAVYAPDLQHAVKIAADARTIFLAAERRSGR